MFLFLSRSFPLSSLSKFAICLNDQQLQLSPLMGRITDILSRKLSTINDARWELFTPICHSAI